MDETRNPLSRSRPEQLSRRIDATRRDLMVTVDEIERRVRYATDVRAQLRRPSVQLAIVLAIGAVALGVALVISRRRSSRQHPFLEALGRVRRHPKRVAQPSPTITRKVAQAALSTAATTAVRRYLGDAIS